MIIVGQYSTKPVDEFVHMDRTDPDRMVLVWKIKQGYAIDMTNGPRGGIGTTKLLLMEDTAERLFRCLGSALGYTEAIKG